MATPPKVNTAIRFELVAPRNEKVSLIGSWNNWKPIPMQRLDRGLWCVDVPLADGDYQYKFDLPSKSYFMDGQQVQVADPTAAELTLDSRENAILHVRNGQRVVTTYQWQHDDKPLPSNQEMIIYELFVADFRGGAGDSSDKKGTFAGVTEKLDYIASLGINTIELMPFNEFPYDHSWGYTSHSIFAIENSYGTPDDLCRLIDECHARGIRVIQDVVYNHMQGEAPLTRIDYEYWFYQNNPDEASLQFGPKFNYEQFDENNQRWPAREHVMDAIKFSIAHFHIDGVRFDCTRAIKYFDLLSWFNNEIHQFIDFKPFYTIAEHIPQDPAIAGHDGPMDAAWHENFMQQINASVLGVSKDGREPFNTTELLRLMDGRTDGFESPYNTVKYIDNHDHDRLMFQLGTDSHTYDAAAFRRNKLGASLLLTAPGIPMIWMGQEFAQPTPKTLEAQPLQWNLLESDNNRGLHAHYTMLMHLRRSNPGLTSENFQILADLPDRGIIAYKRWNDQGNVVLVVANLKDEFAGDFEITDTGMDDGVWREVVYGYETTIQGGRLADSLAESDVKIYVKG